MRLTCPSCGAQYEVPEDVIPETGRDVQCSNCGNTWFQSHDIAGPDEDAEAEADANAPKDAVWHPEVDSDPEDGPSVNVGATPGATPPPTPPKRRELDPSVADILREEAEREARVRDNTAGTFEDQPDLGLQEPEDDAAKRARQAQERMRRLRGEDPDEAASVAATTAVSDRPQSRSDMLPDIDEINQTLRASTERREVRSVQADLYDDEDEAGGFGRGFLFVLVIFAIAAALYIFAPQVSDIAPPIAGVMESYVSGVNAARAWLDGQIATLLAMIGGAPAG